MGAPFVERALHHLRRGVFAFAKDSLRATRSLIQARVALRGTQHGTGVRVRGLAPIVENEGGTIEIGDRVMFDAPVTPTYLVVEEGALLHLGQDCYLNDGVWISATERVHIGDRVKLGPGVRIIDNNYHDRYDRNLRPPAKPVTIEDDVWIAADSMVLPGITIGKGAIVGAHSLVVSDVKPFTVVGGNPAKELSKLDPARLVAG